MTDRKRVHGGGVHNPRATERERSRRASGSETIKTVYPGGGVRVERRPEGGTPTSVTRGEVDPSRVPAGGRIPSTAFFRRPGAPAALGTTSTAVSRVLPRNEAEARAVRAAEERRAAEILMERIRRAEAEEDAYLRERDLDARARRTIDLSRGPVGPYWEMNR